MISFILVALGGALGSVSRYSITLLMKNNVFPLATVIVNIIGSFIIGLLSALFISKLNNFDSVLKPLLVIGFLGGFTTFSSFSMDTLRLIQSEQVLYAITNIVLSIFCGLFMVFLGYKLGNYLGSL